MSAIAAAETVPVDRIHELIVAGEPVRAKAVWKETKPTVNGRKNQIYRLDCIRMRVEHAISRLKKSGDPVDNEAALRIESSLMQFLSH